MLQSDRSLAVEVGTGDKIPRGVNDAGPKTPITTDAEVVRMLRDFYEKLFPKACPNCGRQFGTLKVVNDRCFPSLMTIRKRHWEGRQTNADAMPWPAPGTGAI
jgi:hypothetical protein